MFTVSPSIYSADLLDLRKVLDQAKEFEHIHLDIDDGNFVKGISFGVDLVEQIAAYTDVELDAHLEVLNPLDYVEGLAKAGVKMLSAHIEALPFPSAFLSRAHKLGMKAGLALNLKTPISFIEPYKDDLDLLLFVSVEAGEEGLPFHASVLNKIREARKRFGEADETADPDATVRPVGEGCPESQRNALCSSATHTRGPAHAHPSDAERSQTLERAYRR